MGMWSMRADGLQKEARNSQLRTADRDVIAQLLIWCFVTIAVKTVETASLETVVQSVLRTVLSLNGVYAVFYLYFKGEQMMKSISEK